MDRHERAERLRELGRTMIAAVGRAEICESYGLDPDGDAVEYYVGMNAVSYGDIDPDTGELN